MKTVSILIPTKNRPLLTVEAVQSILDQTYQHWELFVIDDYSSKENFKKLKKILPMDQRVHLIQNKAMPGPSSVRNQIIELGKGEFYGFLDSDDLWKPNKLNLQVSLLIASNKKWCHTNETWYRGNQQVKQRKEHRKQGGLFWKRSLSRCLISPSSVLFKKDFFQQLNGFNASFPLAEDYELWLRALERQPIAFIKEPSTVKRAGNWSQLSSSIEIDKWRILALHRALRRLRNSNSKQNQVRIKALISECKKKSSILVKGALKHQNPKLPKYQSWEYLFNKLLT